MIKRLAIFLLLLLAGKAGAATINAASASLPDVQSAVGTAVNGDTVLLPASQSSTWTSQLALTKGITINFNGCTINRNFSGNSSMISVSTVAGFVSRLTGGNFTGGSTATGFNACYISFESGGMPTPRFRMDHCTFASANGHTMVIVYAVIGLIDHCTFTVNTNHEIIHNEAYGFSSTAGWVNYPITPGSADALYVEDNTFNWTGGTSMFGNSAMQNYYGARTVFRHNTVNNAQYDNHGTGGNIGGRWYEIYENDFYASINCDKVFQLRAGSGVVANNRLHNLPGAAGSRATVLWEEDAGNPALYQIGRGNNQALDPLYIWNNTVLNEGGGTSGFSIDVTTVTPGGIQLNRDYYTTTKPGYTTYTYPHPLITGAPSDTTPPTVTAASINTAGTQLTLTFSESVTANTANGLTLSPSGGAVTVTGIVSGSGTSSVVFSLSRVIGIGETLTRSYVQPGNGIEDTAAGNDMANFTTQSVTNNSTTDITAPTPSPMTFSVAPFADTLTSISMTATTATDATSPPVQYFFDETSGNTGGTDSAWQSSPTYTDTGLTTGTTYTYRVKARDAATGLNETVLSASASATPLEIRGAYPISPANSTRSGIISP